MLTRLAQGAAPLLLLALLLGACGQQQPAAPAPSTAAPAAAADAFVFGMVLIGPINDRGWSQAHYEAAKLVEERLPDTQFIYVDKVNPADRPNVQVEQVVDDLVAQGARLIITNSDDFKDGTLVAAENHPDVTFIHASGDAALTGEAPPNLGNIMGQMEFGKMIAGCAAALRTETGKIAYLGPLINDETRRLVNAAYLGARHCWTELRGQPADALAFKITWIGFWFNIPGVTLDPTQVANDFISSDFDVTISGIDTPEAIVEAGKAFAADKQVFAVPYDYQGACEPSPAACLGTPYFNWFPDYLRTVEAVKSGTWQPEWIWSGPNWENINDLETSAIGYLPGEGLPSEAQSQLDGFIAGLGDGSINLWRGPINFQDGSVFLAEGETLDVSDSEQGQKIWYMTQLFEGIEGQSAAQ